MPKKGRLPKIIDYWAGRIKQENPNLTISEAIAIAIAQAQKYGYLKKGTIKPTKKGYAWSRKRAYGRRLPLDLKRVYREEKRRIKKKRRASKKRKKKRRR